MAVDQLILRSDINQKHMEIDDNQLLAEGIFQQCNDDINALGRRLERKKIKFGTPQFMTERKAPHGTVKNQRDFRQADLDATEAIRFLCWPSKDLQHWADCIGIEMETIIEFKRREFAWMYIPISQGVL